MNAHVMPGLFDDIALRIRHAVEDLRSAVRDGTAADPAAASDLADRMERYADSVLAGEISQSDVAGLKALSS